MNSTTWIFIFLMLFITLQTQDQAEKREKQRYILKTIKAQKRKGGMDMSEVIKRFIGKECIIRTMSENVMGVVESVEDNWVVVSAFDNKTDDKEIINIDYISRIREYPKNKKGKRKAIVA